MLHWFLPYMNMNQPESTNVPLPLVSLSYTPPHATHLGANKSNFIYFNVL